MPRLRQVSIFSILVIMPHLHIITMIKYMVCIFFYGAELNHFIANFARIVCPGKPAARINLVAWTSFRSFDI